VLVYTVYLHMETQARQDMTVALTIVFTTLLHHKATSNTSKGKHKTTTTAVTTTIQKQQQDTDTSACMSLYGVYIRVAYCVVQYDVQETEVNKVLKLFSQG
jgi:hypothetical protein